MEITAMEWKRQVTTTLINPQRISRWRKRRRLPEFPMRPVVMNRLDTRNLHWKRETRSWSRWRPWGILRSRIIRRQWIRRSPYPETARRRRMRTIWMRMLCMPQRFVSWKWINFLLPIILQMRRKKKIIRISMKRRMPITTESFVPEGIRFIRRWIRKCRLKHRKFWIRAFRSSKKYRKTGSFPCRVRQWLWTIKAAMWLRPLADGERKISTIVLT